MGILLFSCYHYKQTNNEKQFEFCNTLVEAIFEKIQNGNTDTIGYCEGLSGVLWAIKHLQKENLIDLEIDDFTNEIDDYIFAKS
jgi:lantibiotic modifying enzyme